MDVTRDNFDAALAELRLKLPNASFVAIDAELTGVKALKQPDRSIIDSLQQAYEKVKMAAEELALIQVGVCLFTWVEEKEIYEVLPMNFYLFHLGFMEETYFSCQANSVDFLSRHKFDFNKVFYKGINYLNLQQEQKATETLKKKHESAQKIVLNREDDIKAINAIYDKVSAWLSNEGEASVEVEVPNAFHRRYLHQETPTRFKNVRVQSKDRKMVFERTEESYDPEEQRRQKDFQALSAAVGFRRVFEAIKSSGKTVLGHNMLLDTLFFTHKLYNPLPSSLHDYKAMLKEFLPDVIDTKLLASNSKVSFNFPDTGLEAAFNASDKWIPRDKFQIVLNGENVEGKIQPHDAAYDALMTGILYARIAAYLANQESPAVPVAPDHEIVQPFVNKIYMMRSIIPFMDLTQDEADPDMSGYVYVYNFGEEVKTNNLLEIFAAIGGCVVKWIDDRSAFCILKDVSKVDQVQGLLQNKFQFLFPKSIRDLPGVVDNMKHKRESLLVQENAELNDISAPRKKPRTDN